MENNKSKLTKLIREEVKKELQKLDESTLKEQKLREAIRKQILKEIAEISKKK